MFFLASLPVIFCLMPAIAFGKIYILPCIFFVMANWKTGFMQVHADVSLSPYSTLFDYWVAHSTPIWFHTTEKLDSYYKQLSTTNSGRTNLGILN